MASPKGYTHIEYLDGMRLVSAFLVVLIHSASARSGKYADLTTSEWMNSFYLNVFFRTPVPIFIAIGGYLIFKSTRKMDVLDFYKKRSFRIVPALLFWSAFYFFWVTWKYGRPFVLDEAITEFYYGMGNSVYYFLFVILGLYIFAPFFKWVWDKNKIAFALLTVASIVFNLSGAVYDVAEVTAFTYFFGYIGFFLLGAYADSYKSNIWLALLSLIVIIVTGLIMAEGTFNNYATLPQNDYRLDNLLKAASVYPLIQSIATFVFLKYVFELVPTGSKLAKIITFITPAAFGVYLMHVPFLDITRHFFDTNDLNGIVVDIWFETICAFTFSLIFSLIILRIKYVNKLIS